MDAFDILEKVRLEKPVVHHLTNWVTIYDCANIVKVFGASPVMAHAKEEVADMAKIASGLVLNIGTLTVDFIDSMIAAAKSANEKGIPVVLDVCGAGATKLRDDMSFKILNSVKIDVIKGNASEVARIAGEQVATKGVDSSDVEKDLIEIAKKLSGERKCCIVITGKEDIVYGNGKGYLISNGCDMMGNVVGTGCMATSVIGAFVSVWDDIVDACAGALVCYEVAAEIANETSKGPGSFKNNLFDSAFLLGRSDVKKRIKIKSL